MQYFSNSKPMLIDKDFKKEVEKVFIKNNNNNNNNNYIADNKKDKNLLDDIKKGFFFFMNENIIPHILFLVILSLIIYFFYYRYINKNKFKKEYSNDERRILDYLENNYEEKKLKEKELSDYTEYTKNLELEYNNLSKLKLSEIDNLNKEYINIQNNYRDLYELRNRQEVNEEDNYKNIWNQNSKNDIGKYAFKNNKMRKGILKNKFSKNLNIETPYA